MPYSSARADAVELYVSSYAVRGDALPTGIHHFAVEPETGALRALGTSAHDAGYSFCVWGTRPGLLYATSALDGGSISGFAVDGSGALTSLGRQRTGGSEPCHISLHPSGRWLFVSNFFGGSISVHPIAADGRPGPSVQLVQHQGHGPDPELQNGPRIHATSVEAGGDYVLALEFGADQLCSYRFDPGSGQLSAIGSAAALPGAGPRHLARLGSRHRVVTDELSATITCYDLQTSAGELARHYTLPATATPPAAGAPRNMPSEIAGSADGRFAYVANRGADVVTAFEVTPGQLRPIGDYPCGGRWPRHFAVAGDFLYVANQRSDSVTAMRVDRQTGELGAAAEVARVSSPVCVLPRYLACR